MKIVLESIVKVNDNVAHRKIAGKIVLVKAPLSTMHTLNDVGGFIWNQIQNQILVKSLVSIVMNEFEVEKLKTEIETIEFLNELYEKKLIEVVL